MAGLAEVRPHIKPLTGHAKARSREVLSCALATALSRVKLPAGCMPPCHDETSVHHRRQQAGALLPLLLLAVAAVRHKPRPRASTLDKRRRPDCKDFWLDLVGSGFTPWHPSSQKRRPVQKSGHDIDGGVSRLRRATVRLQSSTADLDVDAIRGVGRRR